MWINGADVTWHSPSPQPPPHHKKTRSCPLIMLFSHTPHSLCLQNSTSETGLKPQPFSSLLLLHHPSHSHLLSVLCPWHGHFKSLSQLFAKPCPGADAPFHTLPPITLCSKGLLWPLASPFSYACLIPLPSGLLSHLCLLSPSPQGWETLLIVTRQRWAYRRCQVSMCQMSEILSNCLIIWFIYDRSSLSFSFLFSCKLKN